MDRSSPTSAGPRAPSGTNGGFCWNWFTSHWGSTFEPALIQHIELTVIAVGIGFAIAFVLALAAHRAHWLVPPVTFVTSLLCTVPSLAAFEILVPITGINRVTVEIALVCPRRARSSPRS